jgi:hypothetical protein
MNTAVEWLVQQLRKEWQLEYRDLHLIKQAKEMEKQQIIDAYREAVTNFYYDEDAEQYYNETYKKEIT